MSKKDYKSNASDNRELEPLGGPSSPEKEIIGTNGTQVGKFIIIFYDIIYTTNTPIKLNKYLNKSV